jgi:hypothetical protein
MTRVETGAFLMGSDVHYPEEAPARRYERRRDQPDIHRRGHPARF